jgi:hypothetical protein
MSSPIGVRSNDPRALQSPCERTGQTWSIDKPQRQEVAHALVYFCYFWGNSFGLDPPTNSFVPSVNVKVPPLILFSPFLAR